MFRSSRCHPRNSTRRLWRQKKSRCRILSSWCVRQNCPTPMLSRLTLKATCALCCGCLATALRRATRWRQRAPPRPSPAPRRAPSLLVPRTSPTSASSSSPRSRALSRTRAMTCRPRALWERDATRANLRWASHWKRRLKWRRRRQQRKILKLTVNRRAKKNGAQTLTLWWCRLKQRISLRRSLFWLMSVKRRGGAPAGRVPTAQGHPRSSTKMRVKRPHLILSEWSLSSEVRALRSSLKTTTTPFVTNLHSFRG